MSQLADLLESQAHWLVQRWTRRVEKGLGVGGKSEPELRDHLPDVLAELLKALRQGGAPSTNSMAQKHVRQRHRIGFSLEAVVREYDLLRSVILDLMEESNCPLRMEEIRILTDFFSGSVAEGVCEYTLLKEQTEHSLIKGHLDALRESEERLRLVMDALPTLINFVDKEGRYRSNNKAYETWFGVPVGSLRGKRVREVIGDENFQHMRPYAERALAGEKLTWEAPFIFGGGRKGFVEGTFLPQRDATGEVVGYVGLISDITDRKKDEARKKIQAEFEQQRIGIVSHDLRNPLTAILLGAKTLARREELDERAAKSVLRIVRSAERATRLVTDLLDFTQARLGGGIPVHPRSLDLHTSVRQVVDEVQVNFPERHIDVQSEGDGAGAWDPDRLGQVVQNLVSNALKYSLPDTAVVVRTRGDGTDVELQVHNWGTPIPAGSLETLFEPMHRVSSETGRSDGSIGLGLYIVQHVVRAHGGFVHVASTADEGTRFTVRLPRLLETYGNDS